MTHKDAPPLTDDQRAFESAYRATWPAGVTVGLSRDARGIYHAEAARGAWRVWCQAKVYYATTNEPADAKHAIQFFGKP